MGRCNGGPRPGSLSAVLVRGRPASRRGAIPDRHLRAPNIHVDLGGQASTAMANAHP